MALDDMPDVKLRQDDETYTVTGADFRVGVGKASGAIESFVFAGRELIVAPLVPNFWRPPIDNDEGNKMPRRLGAWRLAGPNRSVKMGMAEQVRPQLVRITADATIPVGEDTTYRTVYDVYGSGDIVVEASIAPSGQDLPKLPRFGMQMAIPGRYDTMTWLGRGPHETYWDRKTGAAVGLYSGSVEENIHIYVRPQENGNKTDVRWVVVTNEDDAGLMAVGDPVLSVSAWPFSMSDLEEADHINELPRRDFITLNLDYKQMGVGGDNSWGARTHPEYTLPARPYSYRFRLKPYSPDMGSAQKIARRVLPEVD
jgi:beta-galactosidase